VATDRCGGGSHHPLVANQDDNRGSLMSSTNSQANNFPDGQCTWWADNRYHQLTGYYVPFNGNAADWARNCLAYGWINSSKPTQPSIMCFQPGVQLASALGHVAVVESINNDGTILTSNMNYGSNPSAVVNVTFHAGPGVSFIYAVDGNGNPIGSTQRSLVSTLSSFVGGRGSGQGQGPIIFQLSPNASVREFLMELDTIVEVVNPFNVSAQQDTIGPVTFTDPVDWTQGVAINLFDDMVAIAIRLVFFIVGLFIIVKVIGNFVDYSKIASSAEGVARIAALAAA